MTETYIIKLLVVLSVFWSGSSCLSTEGKMNETESAIINGLREQMEEDFVSDNWNKSIQLMKRHLNESSQAYRELDNITQYHGILPEVVRRGYLELIRVMLYNGLPVNQGYGFNSLTLLHTAALFPQYDIVQLLVKHGADVNAGDSGVNSTPLHSAARGGDVNIAQLLVEKGADINVADNFGRPPLIYAAREGYFDNVQLLVERGANINAADIRGWTSLHYAAEKDYLNITQLLVERGANINATNNRGETPLHIAEAYGHASIVERLRNNTNTT